MGNMKRSFKKALSMLLALTILAFSLVACSRFEYNARIMQSGFTLNESWLKDNYTAGSYQSEYNADLPESRIFLVENQDELEEIFDDFGKVDLKKETVIVYCYTTVYIREQKLEKVSFENGVLNIEFGVENGKPGAGDATAPQTRTCIILLDKLEITDVRVTYNGQ